MSKIPEKPKHSNILQNSAQGFVAISFSRVAGLIREMIFARFFGAGFLYDAYIVAFRIPNLLRDLFAEGALSQAFISVFKDYQIKKGEKEANCLANLIFNVVAVVMSLITIFGIFFSNRIVQFIADGFSPEKAALTASLTQIMFPFILLVSLAAVAMGILNTKNSFIIPHSASTAFNVVSIVFGLGFAYLLSDGGWTASNEKDVIPPMPAQWAMVGMAIGTLIGGTGQILIQVPSLLRAGFAFSPVLNFTDKGVRRVAGMMVPAILGTSAVQINVLVNTYFVSEIDGGQSWLNYAFRLMQFPIGVFGVAVGTASLPVLSEIISRGGMNEFRETLTSSIKLIILLTVPSAFGLIILREPIIRLFFEYGKFSSQATAMTAWALAGYSIGLSGYAAIKILTPAFYALNNSRIPMIISILSIGINLPASYCFREFFSLWGKTAENPHGIGHIGVALATSCIALFNFIALALFARKYIGRIGGREIFLLFIRIVLCSIAMTIVCYFSYYILIINLGTEGFLFRFLEVLVPITLGIITFLRSAKVFGIRESDEVFQLILSKFNRKAAGEGLD